MNKLILILLVLFSTSLVAQDNSRIVLKENTGYRVIEALLAKPEIAKQLNKKKLTRVLSIKKTEEDNGDGISAYDLEVSTQVGLGEQKKALVMIIKDASEVVKDGDIKYNITVIE